MRASSRDRARGGGRGAPPAAASVFVVLACAALLLLPTRAVCVATRDGGDDDDLDLDLKLKLKLTTRALETRPSPGDVVVIRARLDVDIDGDGGVRAALARARLANEENVTLTTFTRVNFQDEQSWGPMRDDGVFPDVRADDGEYAAAVRVPGDGAARGGDVFRWRVEATRAAAAAATSRSPKFDNDERPRYRGTVVMGDERDDDDDDDDDDGDDAAALERLHVFTEDPDGMSTDDGAAVSLFFRGRYYDSASVRRRGSGRAETVVGVTLPPKDWPKKKLKVDMKRGEKFVWSNDERGVSEFNLQSHFQEPGEETYMRENLASATFAAAGVPAPAMFHLVVYLNGAYHGLYSFVERVDETFMKRNGLDDKADAYKAVHWKYSNLRAPNVTAQCPWATPDWPARWEECPEVWRVVNGDAKRAMKASEALELDAYPIGEGRWRRAPSAAAVREVKTLKSAAFAPLTELTTTLARVVADPRDIGDALLMDALDVPAILNEMAAQTLVLSVDRCAKNYFVTRDRDTLEWRRLPWDLEDAFPVDYRDGIGRCDAATQCGANETDYCLLTCDKFNSVFFCDANHPQDVFVDDRDGMEAKSTYNVLVDAILKTPKTRAMYLRRLRTLADALLMSYFIDRTAMEYLRAIKNDARRDSEKWNVGGVRAVEQGVLQLRSQFLPARRRQLLEETSEMPPPQREDVRVAFGDVDEAREDRERAFAEVINPNDFAVDLSGWTFRRVLYKRFSPISRFQRTFDRVPFQLTDELFCMESSYSGRRGRCGTRSRRGRSSRRDRGSRSCATPPGFDPARSARAEARGSSSSGGREGRAST